jgi:predicted dehydrogenase
MGRTLARAVEASGLWTIRAVFDRDAMKSLALAQVYQAKAASTQAALLADQEIQAVIIALPPFLHRDSVMHAIQAGKHVFLEKPMALDSASCNQMNTAAQKAGLSLMVGHVLRYFEPFRTITRWAQSGRLGKPLHGDIWRVEHDYLRLAQWKGMRSLSGGYLFEVGAHELDWLRCLFGEPTNTQAVIQKQWPAEHEIEDMVSLQIQFSSGAVGTYLGGTGFPLTEYGFCLRFERATLRSLEAFNPRAHHIEWLEGSRAAPEEVVFAREDPFEAEIHAWLSSLMAGEPVAIPGEEARKTVALIEAAYQNAQWTAPAG